MECMVDIETLSTDRDAVVLSIGAVNFELDGEGIEDTFHLILNRSSQEMRGRKIDSSTTIWWMEQSAVARSVFSKDTVLTPVATALSAFTHFCKNANTLWGNGSTFDNIILRSLFSDYNMVFPFSYWEDRDLRTLKQLAGITKLDIERGTEHNALDDAIHQTKCAQRYYQILMGE